MPGIDPRPWRIERQIVTTRPHGNSWFCGNPFTLNAGWQARYLYCKNDRPISEIFCVGGKSNPGLSQTQHSRKVFPSHTDKN